MIAHLAGSSLAFAAEPMFSDRRIVLRLRPEAARTAWLERTRGDFVGPSGSARPRSLDALARRISALRLEPEFPGEPPGGDPDLSQFWIAHLEPEQPLDRALAAASSSSEVSLASKVARVPVEPLSDPSTWLGTPDLSGGGRRTAPEILAVPPPDDSLWSRCYWLYQSSRRDLHALEAWEVTRGDPSAVIAILDTGVLRWHPDLGGTTAGDPGRFWTNSAESGGVPGVDDDGNGYVDDTWGWDFVSLDTDAYVRPGEDWGDADNDPTDLAVHGTAVAGVVAAIANNGAGTVGVAPLSRIMALRVGYSALVNPAGVVDMTWVAQAMLYAARNGATVINCSFSSPYQFDLEAAATAATRAGVTIVAAAGNHDPFNYLQNRPDVISVAATDQLDKITLFSTREDWVDLAAPGQSIATTTLRATGTDSIARRTPHYSGGEAGTSFSAPMVSAAAALLQTDRVVRGKPPLTPEQVGFRLTETTDDIASLNPGGGFGTGRLNLERMLTDPPHSSILGAGARTVGAAVIRPSSSGGAWIAHATADGNLLVLSTTTEDTVALVPLGGVPVGGPAAGERGGGQGPALFVALQHGLITAHDFAGQPLAGWPVATAPTRGDFEYSPALADLDGDGVPEVIWGGSDGNVWAWRLDGSRLPGFPRSAGFAGNNLRLALADLDGFPGAEIVVTANNDSIYAFLGDGRRLYGWPVLVEPDPTAPLIMRRGAAGGPMVVVGGGNLLYGFGRFGAPLFRRNFWPYYFFRELASGDLTGDGIEEIFAIVSTPFHLLVLDSSGVVLARRDLSSRTVGGPIVGPLAPGDGAQVLLRESRPEGDIDYRVLDSNLELVAGWRKAGHPGISPSLADFDGDGATEIAAGSGGAGRLYVYEAGPGTWRETPSGWPTARGNHSRTGSRLTDQHLAPIDDAGPTAVQNLQASNPGTRGALLGWSAPADVGVSGVVTAYEIRVADEPIDGSNFASTQPVPQSIRPAKPGSYEFLEVGGLKEAAIHWFALRSRDGIGNWSVISNVPALATASVSPAAVSDLQVVSGGLTSLMLAWTATGDDGSVGRPARYRVRWSESPIDSAAFDLSTQGADLEPTVDGGSMEAATLRGLSTGKDVWVRLRAVDAVGNRSPLSNSAVARVGRLAGISGVALTALRSPSSVPVEIEWQGDPASSGPQTLTLFDLSGRVQRRFRLPADPSGLLVWDGHTESGRRAPAGIYFARLTSGRFAAVTRLVLLR